MNAIREMTKENIEFVGMPSAKFMSPLNPEEPLTIRIDRQGDGTTGIHLHNRISTHCKWLPAIPHHRR